MGNKVLVKIISELKKSKHFSISVNSTSDLSHADQLTFIIRYDILKMQHQMNGFEFAPIHDYGAEYLKKVDYCGQS